MESNSESGGICRRFIKFIRSKRNRPAGTAVPIEEGMISKADGFVGSEIVVEFRHKDGSEISTRVDDRTIMPKKERKGHQELDALKKNVTIKGSDEEEEKLKKKKTHEDTKLNPERRLKSLLSIDSNINKKCDAYIESRKKAMEETYERKLSAETSQRKC